MSALETSSRSQGGCPRKGKTWRAPPPQVSEVEIQTLQRVWLQPTGRWRLYWMPWVRWSPVGEQEITHLWVSETPWTVSIAGSLHDAGSCTRGWKQDHIAVRKPCPLVHLALPLQWPLLEKPNITPSDKGKNVCTVQLCYLKAEQRG